MNEGCANIKIEQEARPIIAIRYERGRCWTGRKRGMVCDRVFLPPMRPSQQRRIALARRFVSYPNLGQHLLWFASPPAQASSATDPQQGKSRIMIGTTAAPSRDYWRQFGSTPAVP